MSLLHGEVRDYLFKKALPSPVNFSEGNGSNDASDASAVDLNKIYPQQPHNQNGSAPEPGPPYVPPSPFSSTLTQSKVQTAYSVPQLPQSSTSCTDFYAQITTSPQQHQPDIESLRANLVSRCRQVCEQDVEKRRTSPKRLQVQQELRRISAQNQY